MVKNVGKIEKDDIKKESGEQYEASAAALIGKKEFNIEIIDPKKIESYLLCSPVIPFGIDKKANRIINRSYEVVGGSKEMREYCTSILENSGGEIFLKNWIKDAYGFGTGYAQLVRDVDHKQIVKCIIKHPVYFGYLKEKKSSDGGVASFFSSNQDYTIVFNEEKGHPEGFCPYVYKSSNRIPVPEKKIPFNLVAPLKFDTWGDEIEGISVVQYIHENIRQIINIENAGAEQLYRNGFTQKKFTTNIRSIEKLKTFAKSVSNMNEKDAIVLLDGTDVQNLQPGNSDFVPFHKEFLNLLSIALGIPTALLTLDGQNVNKASLSEMRSEMYQDSFADELIIKKTIDESIFYNACKMKNPKISFEDIPQFVFKKRKIEINEELEMRKKWSEYILNVSNSVKSLSELGFDDEAKELIGSIHKFKPANNQPIQGVFEEGRIVKGTKKKGLFSRILRK